MELFVFHYMKRDCPLSYDNFILFSLAEPHESYFIEGARSCTDRPRNGLPPTAKKRCWRLRPQPLLAASPSLSCKPFDLLFKILSL